MQITHNLSFGLFLYILVIKPFENDLAVYTELINEFTFYLICSCLYFFCPGQDNYELKEYIGWFMIGITILNVLINFTIVIISTIKGMRTYYRKYKFDKF